MCIPGFYYLKKKKKNIPTLNLKKILKKYFKLINKKEVVYPEMLWFFYIYYIYLI